MPFFNLGELESDYTHPNTPPPPASALKTLKKQLCTIFFKIFPDRRLTLPQGEGFRLWSWRRGAWTGKYPSERRPRRRV